MSFAGFPSRGREHCNVLSASIFSHAVWFIQSLHLLPEPARCFVIFVDFVGGFLGSVYDSRRSAWISWCWFLWFVRFPQPKF
jgi:hypothetical protein